MDCSSDAVDGVDAKMINIGGVDPMRLEVESGKEREPISTSVLGLPIAKANGPSLELNNVELLL